jgi:sugar phosphate isomerase/epimerase
MKKTFDSLLFSVFVLVFMQACTSNSDTSTKTSEPLFTSDFGVQAYTFRNQFKDSTWTLEAVLDTIAGLGFREFEAGAPKNMSPEDYKQMCLDRGIKIVSTGASFDEMANDPQAVADRAKAIGASYVMCAWIPHDGETGFNFEDAQKAVKVFNEGGKVLADNGITFCYHDHGYEFKPNPEGDGTLLDYIVQNTDQEHVSFEMDVLWTIHGGGVEAPQQLLEKYGNRWKLMHVKDLKKGVVGDGIGHTPAENDVILGTGQANWPEIIALANKVGIKHFFIEDESENEFIHIPQSLEYLRNL